ncbi:hypothetical protein CLF_107497 [Clonorchis sinensis]|uniref:Uncharacterized protein n=1 Tax=Clonorchis sinensis TaxID=79923 RepID=G7YQM7_CLOSI|nr:hypothetical protein CLF_107497 [Clonorchis sinensis]
MDYDVQLRTLLDNVLQTVNKFLGWPLRGQQFQSKSYDLKNGIAFKDSNNKLGTIVRPGFENRLNAFNCSVFRACCILGSLTQPKTSRKQFRLNGTYSDARRNPFIETACFGGVVVTHSPGLSDVRCSKPGTAKDLHWCELTGMLIPEQEDVSERKKIEVEFYKSRNHPRLKYPTVMSVLICFHKAKQPKQKLRSQTAMLISVIHRFSVEILWKSDLILICIRQNTPKFIILIISNIKANATKRLHKFRNRSHFARDAKRIYEKTYYSPASSVVSSVTLLVFPQKASVARLSATLRVNAFFLGHKILCHIFRQQILGLLHVEDFVQLHSCQQIEPVVAYKKLYLQVFLVDKCCSHSIFQRDAPKRRFDYAEEDHTSAHHNAVLNLTVAMGIFFTVSRFNANLSKNLCQGVTICLLNQSDKIVLLLIVGLLAEFDSWIANVSSPIEDFSGFGSFRDSDVKFNTIFLVHDKTSHLFDTRQSVHRKQNQYLGTVF